jgi:orotidine-5'-phosphate decarboxylase
LIVGVTVLTSQAQDADLENVVLERARLSRQAGLDGVVASVEEAAMIRRELGPEFLIVTPGIRPADASLNDQKRVATPQAAIQQGSNFLVVGRPIIQATSPRNAALKILEEMKN